MANIDLTARSTKEVLERKDESIFLFARTDTGYIAKSESFDGGKTWTTPVALLDRTGGAPAHLIRHSSGMLISAYGYRNAPYGIRAMFSTDDGKTWDTGYDIYVNYVSGDLGYPTTVELSDGSLITVFYARPDKNNVRTAVILQQKWCIEE